MDFYSKIFLLAFDYSLFQFSVIENLPMEMRDRFTEMREMDLQVQSKLGICIGKDVIYLLVYMGFLVYSTHSFILQK